MYVSMAKKIQLNTQERKILRKLYGPVTEQEVWRNRTKGIIHKPLSGSKFQKQKIDVAEAYAWNESNMDGYENF